MKHLSRLNAEEVAKFVTDIPVKYAKDWARQIRQWADKDGTIFYFAVMDLIGYEWIEEYEASVFREQ